MCSHCWGLARHKQRCRSHDYSVAVTRLPLAAGWLQQGAVPGGQCTIQGRRSNRKALAQKRALVSTSPVTACCYGQHTYRYASTTLWQPHVAPCSLFGVDLLEQGNKVTGVGHIIICQRCILLKLALGSQQSGQGVARQLGGAHLSWRAA